jgi:hypothetical protein
MGQTALQPFGFATGGVAFLKHSVILIDILARMW